MKWILVALGGLSIVALGTGAVEAHLWTAGGAATVGIARSVSVSPTDAALRAVPAYRPVGGAETAVQAPKTAPATSGPATTGPAQVAPGPGVSNPGCGAVGSGKAQPACPPG
jgi:hypothetical protein